MKKEYTTPAIEIVRINAPVMLLRNSYDVYHYYRNDDVINGSEAEEVEVGARERGMRSFY